MSAKFSNPFTLEGKTVLVVGASSGIGAATSRLASELGANILLASRTRQSLEAVRDQLVDPSRAAVLPMDYLDPASVQGALKNVRNVDHVLISAVADENKKRGHSLIWTRIQCVRRSTSSGDTSMWLGQSRRV